MLGNLIKESGRSHNITDSFQNYLMTSLLYFLGLRLEAKAESRVYSTFYKTAKIII